MNVIFVTNLDAYDSGMFPAKVDHLPRKGELVRVLDHIIPVMRGRKFPIDLEVVQVTHTEHKVIIEIWFRDIDLKLAKASGINLF